MVCSARVLGRYIWEVAGIHRVVLHTEEYEVIIVNDKCKDCQHFIDLVGSRFGHTNGACPKDAMKRRRVYANDYACENLKGVVEYDKEQEKG